MMRVRVRILRADVQTNVSAHTCDVGHGYMNVAVEQSIFACAMHTDMDELAYS